MSEFQKASQADGQVIDISSRRRQRVQPTACVHKDHSWLLPVMDSLIDYCDEQDLPKSADRLRRVVAIVVEETMSKSN